MRLLKEGDPLTIYGSGFGATQQQGIVGIGPDANGIVTAWGPTQIAVTVPSTGLEPGNVVVKQYGVLSNGIAFTVSSSQCLLRTHRR